MQVCELCIDYSLVIAHKHVISPQINERVLLIAFPLQGWQYSVAAPREQLKDSQFVACLLLQ